MSIYSSAPNEPEGTCEWCGGTIFSKYNDSHSRCQDANERGRADERAKVVEWLRKGEFPSVSEPSLWSVSDLADALERGEHVKP